MGDWDIKALIVDDDDTARSIMTKYLEVEDNVHIIDSVSNSFSAMKAVEREEPDVIFLDINMPKEDGLQFARRLKQMGINSAIVFTTAYRNYALYAFELKPLDYLIKPFGPNEVSAVIAKVAERLTQKFQNRSEEKKGLKIPGKLMLKAVGGTFFVSPAEIIFFRMNIGGMEMAYVNGKLEKLKMLISELEEELNSATFIRISRSVIININFLNRIDKKEKRCHLKCCDKDYSFELTKAKIKYFDSLSTIKLG